MFDPSFFAELPGNAEKYSLEKLTPLPDNKLKGKRIYWLGSSVTEGLTSQFESVPDFLAKHNGCICIKEAVSGTTLAQTNQPEPGMSYAERIAKLPLDRPDLFVLQLSSNDSVLPKNLLGDIEEGFSKDSFDRETTLGALQYILGYAQDTWQCPVLLYTSPMLTSGSYPSMVRSAQELAKKWHIFLLDLNSDTEFTAAGLEHFDLYMVDSIHPTRAGYQLWWLPKFEQTLNGIF